MRRSIALISLILTGLAPAAQAYGPEPIELSLTVRQEAQIRACQNSGDNDHAIERCIQAALRR